MPTFLPQRTLFQTYEPYYMISYVLNDINMCKQRSTNSQFFLLQCLLKVFSVGINYMKMYILGSQKNNQSLLHGQIMVVQSS